MDIFSLVARLTLDKSDYDNGLGQAAESAQGFGAKLKKGFGVAAAAATAVAGAASAAAAVVTKEVGALASYGDNIDKMSQKLGLSAEAYQEWDAVLQHSGTSIDSLGVGLKTLTAKAESGSEAFDRLGISQAEAASMSREELFNRSITALQNVENENERAALATELFGKSAMELGPLLNTSAADTQAMKDRVHELGGVLSNDAVKAAAAYQDSLQDMTTAFTGVKRNLMSQFLPSITTVMDGITDLFSGKGVGRINEGIGVFVKQLSDTIPNVLDAGTEIVITLADAVIQNLPMLTQAATDTIITLVNGIVKELPMLVSAGLQIILELANGIADNMPELVPTIVDVVLEIVDVLTEPDTLSNLIDAALKIIVALADGLIKALPKLIAKAPTIIANLVESLLKIAPKVLEAGVSLIGTLARGLIDGIGSVITAIGSIGEKIWNGFVDIGRGAVQWGRDLIDNFTAGIKEFIHKPIDAVKGLASRIKSFLGFSEPEEGPLANFHTYAPDMMKLFAEGITDNRGVITDAIGDAFNIAPSIHANSVSGREFTVPRATANAINGQPIQIDMILDNTVIGRALLPYIEAERVRVGVNLVTGGVM